MVSLAKIGSYAFILGVVIAILAVIVPAEFATGVAAALVILGLIVGILNVTEHETKDFVLLSTALVVVSSVSGTSLDKIPQVGLILQTIFGNIVLFVVPAVIVVALVGIKKIAESE